MEYVIVALSVSFVLSLLANIKQSGRIDALESFGAQQDEYIDKLVREVISLKAGARATDANTRDTLTESAFAEAFPEDALGR